MSNENDKNAIEMIRNALIGFIIVEVILMLRSLKVIIYLYFGKLFYTSGKIAVNLLQLNEFFQQAKLISGPIQVM